VTRDTTQMRWSRISRTYAEAVIPPRSTRTEHRAYDRHVYKDRNLVERFFHRLKQFRRMATRYDNLARNFVSLLNLGVIVYGP
jgi:transposase